MPANPTYLDGALEYGSAALSITPKTGANPVRSLTTLFVALADAAFSFSKEVKEVDQTGQFGEYNGGFGIPGKVKGTVVIQLPAGRRAYAGDTFTVDTAANDEVTVDATLFQIVTADQPYEKDGYRKQSLAFFVRKYALDNTTLNTPAPA